MFQKQDQLCCTENVNIKIQIEDFSDTLNDSQEDSSAMHRIYRECKIGPWDDIQISRTKKTSENVRKKFSCAIYYYNNFNAPYVICNVIRQQ